MNEKEYRRRNAAVERRIAAHSLANDRLLVLTHRPEGDSYGLDNGRAITCRRAAEIQSDLFVKPQDDGLFPGFSQTWRRDA